MNSVPTAAREASDAARFLLNGNFKDETVGTLWTWTTARLREGRGSITILIDSHGGQVSAGIAMYGILRHVPDLTVHAIGAVCSAAILPFLAADRRFAVPEATFMIHGARRHETSELTLEMCNEIADQLRLDNGIMHSVLAERTQIPKERIAEYLANSVRWSATEAKSSGLVTDIVPFNILGPANAG